MSAQPQPVNGQQGSSSDLIDRIANALPEELRVALRQVAIEHEQLAQVLAHGTESIQATHRASVQTGLPAVADAIGVQAATLRHASKALSAALDEFVHSRTGAVPRVNDVLRWVKADLQNAVDHIRTQRNGLGKELYRTIAVPVWEPW